MMSRRRLRHPQGQVRRHRRVVTNTTTVGAYRGAGRPEATQLIERVIDVAADKIGMDPAEIRRKNFIQPDAFPLTTNTGAALRLRRVREGARRRARRRPATTSCAPSRRAAGPPNDPIALGIGVSSLRRGHRAGRPARRVRRRRDPRRRHGQRVRRHQRARPGPPHRVRHARQRGARHPDGQDQARQLRHRQGAARCRARWVRARCRRPAAPSSSRPNEVLEPGPARSPRTCSRPPPTTSSPATAPARRRVPRRSRSPGPSWPSRRKDALEAARRASSPARCATSSTSTAPTRRSRSARTCRSSRSTPRPARSRCSATSPSTTAAASSTRCSSSGQQHGGIAQGAAQALYEWVRYDDDGNPITSTLIDYAIPSAAELPQLRDVEHPDRQPAQPARRQGHRRVRHDRLDAGDPERRRRRRVAPRRHAHRHAVHARARVGCPQRRLGSAAR